jgi:hypothetical protein
MSQPGLFTDTMPSFQYANYVFGFDDAQTIGSAECPVFNGTESGVYSSIGLEGFICTPSSGTTNTENIGLYGQAFVNDPNAAGQAGDVEGVGVGGSSNCSASNTECWAFNGTASSASGSSEVELVGMETGITQKNTTDTGYGYVATMSGTAQITGDNAPAFWVNNAGPGLWTSGFETSPGSIPVLTIDGVGSRPAVNIAAIASGRNEASQSILFQPTGSTFSVVPYAISASVDSNGNVGLSVIGGGNGGYIPFPEIQAGIATGILSGCSLTNELGGQTAGSFKSGTTGTCTVTVTPGVRTAPNGYSCWARDLTTPADAFGQTAYTTTTATLSGTTSSGDLITWGCVAF